jgi:transcription elongation factor Elf1
MPNQLGKRFRCRTCGSEVLCTKAGDGAVECCGQAMEVMQPKVLPSAD